MPSTAAATIKATAPNDIESLKRLLAEREAMVTVRDAMVLERDLLIEKLKLQIARMKRARFGATSEQLDTEILQLELIVEEESTQGALAAAQKLAMLKFVTSGCKLTQGGVRRKTWTGLFRDTELFPVFERTECDQLRIRNPSEPPRPTIVGATI